MPRMSKNEKKMMEFNKRYDRFKRCNLPAPFFDDERQVFEYVYFENEPDKDKRLVVSHNLYNAFEYIIWDQFYYPFNSRHYVGYYDEDGKYVHKEEIGHVHEHDFDCVIRWVYEFPETFSIDKEDEHFYSEQELRFIKHLQNYLLFIGIKDLKYNEKRTTRSFNKKRKKYENAYIRACSDKKIKEILSGELNYDVYKYQEGYELKNYKKGECICLVVNTDDKFVMSLEFGNSELKSYKDVKKYYKMDLKDNDKVIVSYFKIKEKF